MFHVEQVATGDHAFLLALMGLLLAAERRSAPIVRIG